MNGRKFKRRALPRRRRRVLKRSRRRTININRALQPIAQRTIVRMKYAEQVSMSASGGIPAKQLFNLNSIYDPNRTGLGHQPYGHDTFQGLYNRYRVISVSWNITIQSVASEIITLCVLPCNEENSTLSLELMRESPRCRYIVQGCGAGQTTRTLKGRISLPSLVGRTRAQYMADDRYQSQFANSPSELAVLHCFAGNTGGSITGPCVMSVVLTYTVECFDPHQLSQS